MWNRGPEESPVDIWWSLHLRREPASVPLARRVLMGTMTGAGVDPDVGYEIATALTEACANAVEHVAGPEDEGYQVSVRIAGDRVHVQVRNSATPPVTVRPAPRADATRSARSAAPGRGCRRRRPQRRRPLIAADRPEGDSPALLRIEDAGHELPDGSAESGRGLFLIRALVDHVQFRAQPGHGTVVSFDKALRYREPPVLQAS
jgi:serine/threonine-protein kinase RsbW